MDNLVMAVSAIEAVNKSELAFCKFLSANDTGVTGAHQAGIYISKPGISILFDAPGVKGSNIDRMVKIKWQDDFFTDSRFIYYGTGTRNEYRITRFDRGFPFLRPEHTGDLFVLTKLSEDDYSAYILQTEDEMNEFLNTFGMSPSDTGTLITKGNISSKSLEDIEMERFILSLTVDFPTSEIMANKARAIFDFAYKGQNEIIQNPDKRILSWTEAEYKLFRKIEFVRYGEMINRGFQSVEQFINIANMVLNRRKSRAGRSLELHLAAIFDGNELAYTAQPKTEGNRRPDFIFPGMYAYHSPTWPTENLVFLGAKTTCKDRWRQILNEANRIDVKHLFTLQQGISPQQLDEMAEEKVILVVPEPYIKSYPQDKHNSIWTLKKFIDYTKEKTER